MLGWWPDPGLGQVTLQSSGYRDLRNEYAYLGCYWSWGAEDDIYDMTIGLASVALDLRQQVGWNYSGPQGQIGNKEGMRGVI